jgi:hypothetical protein
MIPNGGSAESWHARSAPFEKLHTPHWTQSPISCNSAGEGHIAEQMSQSTPVQVKLGSCPVRLVARAVQEKSDSFVSCEQSMSATTDRPGLDSGPRLCRCPEDPGCIPLLSTRRWHCSIPGLCAKASFSVLLAAPGRGSALRDLMARELWGIISGSVSAPAALAIASAV